ncbi:polyprenol phosphomannose-dependent alpha 1,6 mannosyltransferase MptB [Actinoplanes sp. CA-030573]|uniref:polyprenol phosphomannose-dependent alpha 1,6 mannosyltransferase MptB n=1 Tax=Actinoplanes sp. CA-030573 TaxID=3239898 RepID=UPI003D8BB48E
MSRPALVRYAGLAGSLLLAVAAWLGGAHRPWEPTITPGTIVTGKNGVVLPLAWLFGTALLIGAWWAGRRQVPSTRWAYVTAALWLAPFVAFLPLGSYDIYSYACQGWQQAAGLDPYAGGVHGLGCPWADAVAPTWRDSPAPYGPVFLLLAGLAAKLGGGHLAGTLAGLRIIALLGVALIAVCLPALARRGGVPPERAVFLVLACPLVPIHLVSGAHNDAVMVGFLLAGLTVAVIRRSLLSAVAVGVLLGLAIGVKATAVVVVPFAVLLVASYQTPGSAPRLRANGARIAALLAGVIGALLVVSLASGRGLGWITGLEGSGVSVQWTSPATAVGLTIGVFGVDAVPVTRAIGIVLLAVVLVVLWLRAWTRDPLRYAAYALAATVVLAPVFHPWYAVWALALLAPTVRRETRWLIIPCAVVAALCMPDGYNLALATRTQGAIAMTALLGYFGYKYGKAWHEAKNRHPVAARGVDPADRLPGREP